MLETQVDSPAPPSKSSRQMGSLDTRIDGPHSMRLVDAQRSRGETTEHTLAGEEEIRRAEVTRNYGSSSSLAMTHSSAELLEELRTQAQQLAGHLRSRQQDLDRREAELHTRLASLDNEWRAARMWLNEQRQELLARAETLDCQQKEHEERGIGLNAAEEDRALREQEFMQRQAEVENEAQQLVVQQMAQRKALVRFRNRRRGLTQPPRPATCNAQAPRRPCPKW